MRGVLGWGGWPRGDDGSGLGGAAWDSSTARKFDAKTDAAKNADEGPKRGPKLLVGPNFCGPKWVDPDLFWVDPNRFGWTQICFWDPNVDPS